VNIVKYELTLLFTGDT